jgi:hypothetical protein
LMGDGRSAAADDWELMERYSSPSCVADKSDLRCKTR